MISDNNNLGRQKGNSDPLINPNRNTNNSIGRQDSLRNVSLPKSGASTVEDFVRNHEGNRVIKKILIANNGIAAVKFIRSIRSWTYETFRDQHAIRFVCMVTPEDRTANAEYIKMSDKIETVPGGSNQYNYANVDLILDVAVRTKVDAVWAGWGHASENPKLPEILSKNNIIFIGPNHEAMWCLGDKVASTIFAQSCNIPTLPWSGSGLKLNPTNMHSSDSQNIKFNLPENPDEQQQQWTVNNDQHHVYHNLPEDIYYSACINDNLDGLARASEIGFPVMIKASEGGGGKGIRKATNPDNFNSLYQQVQNEVPGSPIFLMKFADHARHLEVQLLADQYGSAISLFGRDCSVQRRHQKILEEAPVVVAPESVFEQMELAAIKLAQTVGYVSAGTVEYLYDMRTQKFHFLELNPRLQVEHPCTEVVCDVNLPACQLQVAMGLPLHRIKDVRRLYKQPSLLGNNIIDFSDPVNKPRPNGHVIAVRITSENPDEGFKPSPGTMDELNFKSNRSVWGYFSVGSVGGIHEYSDSQFGHCFSFAENREKARENMVLTLKEMSIRGNFRTTVEYLIKILESENYVTNEIDTGWLDYLILEKVQVMDSIDPVLAAMCASIHIGDHKLMNNFNNYQTLLERRQISKSQKLTNIIEVVLIHHKVKYSMQVCKTGPITYHLIMNSACVEAEVHRLLDGCLLITYENTSYTTYCKEEVYGFRIIIDNQTITFEKESDPSILMSPSTGKLVQYEMEDGGHVLQGNVYAYMEVMKLTMELKSTASGCIHYIKRPGAILDAGVPVANLTLDDPGQVIRAEPYQGSFYVSTQQLSSVAKLNQVFEKSYHELEQILDGYSLPEPFFQPRLEKTVNQLMACLRDPRLPLVELQELMSQIAGRIPLTVERQVKQHMSQYASNVTSVLCQFPSNKLLHVLNSGANSLAGGPEHDNYLIITQPVFQLVKKYSQGVRGYMKWVVDSLFFKYIAVEREFQEGHQDKNIGRIIEQNAAKNQSESVMSIVYSHQRVSYKNMLILALIEHLVKNESGLIKDLHDTLLQFTELNKADNARVALRARQVLIAAQNPAYEVRHNQVESIFLSAIDRYGHQFRPENLERLILSETVVFDIIFAFFYHSNIKVISAALEVYVRRAYIAYELTCVHQCQLSNDRIIIEFRFLLPNTHPDRIGSHYRSINKTSSYQSFKGTLINTPSTESLESIHEGCVPPISCGRRSPHRSPHFTERISPTESPVIPSAHHRMSLSDPTEASKSQQLDLLSPPCQRMGIMAAFFNLQEFENVFDEVMEHFSMINDESDESSTVVAFQDPPYCTTNPQEEPIHIINIALKEESKFDDVRNEKIFEDLCSRKQGKFRERGIRRITFLVSSDGSFPRYFTFRAKNEFKEDRIYRHLEPALAFQLEINRMRNYELELIPVVNRRMHLYLARAKANSNNADCLDYRFFVRSIIRHADLVTKEASFEYLTNEAERTLLESLDALELASMTHPDASRTNSNHIFLNFAPTLTLPDLSRLEETVRAMVMRYGNKLWKLRVAQAELKMTVRFSSSHDEQIPIRMWLANEGGYDLEIAVYKEVYNPDTGQVHFRSFDSHSKSKGKLHGMLLDTPYQTNDRLQMKRFQAIKFNTPYVYDYPKLIKQTLESIWTKYDSGFLARNTHLQLVECKELILDNVEARDPQLIESDQIPGSNSIGMVAWRMKLLTPESIDKGGREIVVICNDVTYKMGSFSTLEDMLFFKASEYSRKLGLPRIYFSSNCGARIGLAEELKGLFRVAWRDPEDEDKGYKYLYLSPSDYKNISGMNNVICELIEDDGESRYKITDIIGKEDGIGVENLRASGMIAGETSQAYDEVVTMSLVSSRAVGIGAYLVRLGSRVVQVDNSHIILTGAAALNKVLGNEIYSSNSQLGGVQIMANNGITHAVVDDELRGILCILRWLSYIPFKKGGPLPVMTTGEDVQLREVKYMPPASGSSTDPRLMITGTKDEPGLFDMHSWGEILEGWARSVVVGRARLCGIPVAVITPETRTVTVEVPADPANPSSEFQQLQQAGQVWFPCSAYKTAQALRDFNREELPLIILANWRGFSGGMKDMYDEVLKYGSYIVDELRQYSQPVLVYIGPHCELRGGAWVVLDPTINAQQNMEMFADPLSAQGNVLEPEGLVEIKYREKDIIKTINRLDHECISLRKEIISVDTKEIDQKSKLEAQLNARVKKLMPIYQQIAVSFAALHDTPGRMMAKGVLHGLVPWQQSRTLLYHRLRRRLAEKEACKLLANELPAQIPLFIGPPHPGGHLRQLLIGVVEPCFIADHNKERRSNAKEESLVSNSKYLWTKDDVVVYEWLTNQIAQFKENGGGCLYEHMRIKKRDMTLAHIKRLVRNNPEMALNCMMSLVQELNPTQLAGLSNIVQTLIQSASSSANSGSTGMSQDS